MKEELTTKLVEILSSIQTATEKASDFALEQLPEIAQSYVLYGRVSTVVSTLLMILVGMVFLCICTYAYKKPWNHSTWSWDKGRSRDDGNIMLIGFSGAIGIAVITVALASFNWLVWLAPKVWLLKEIAGLMK